MSSAKDVILERIRKALGDVPEDEQPEDVDVARQYRRQGALPQEKVVDLFAARVGEYQAMVKRINRDDLETQISESCRRQEVAHRVVPPGFTEIWLPGNIELMQDNRDSPLSNRDLDSSDGVITTCALAVAQTGTIILDGGEGQGRRALTLLPDYHLCIVGEDQIVELFPEAVAHIEDRVRQDGPPITLISGPSATSDIELSRVEGVHGPRRLEVLIVSES